MYRKIGILCAGDSELAPFLPHLEHARTSEKALLKFYEGTLCGLPAVLLYSGVCKVDAAIAAQILIDTYRADAVINAGTAGGMDPSLNIFDTAVSTAVAYHDVADDILTDFHPWLESIWFPADPALRACAEAAAAKQPREYPVRFGRMVTGEAFITDDGGRRSTRALHRSPWIWSRPRSRMSATRTASRSSRSARSPIRPTTAAPGISS